MIRMALHMALRNGHTGAQVRAAVERWLAAVPPDRIVVVDPAREMAELLVHELKQGLGIEAECATPEEVAAQPAHPGGGAGAGAAVPRREHPPDGARRPPSSR